MNCFRKTALMAMLTLPFLAFATGGAAAQQVDCSAAVQRVLNQTNGQLLSVKLAKNGGQNVCKVTVLAEGKNGQRRRKVTVNARP
jgi:hypothetical protein